jgi:hypothetical protein
MKTLSCIRCSKAKRKCTPTENGKGCVRCFERGVPCVPRMTETRTSFRQIKTEISRPFSMTVESVFLGAFLKEASFATSKVLHSSLSSAKKYLQLRMYSFFPMCLTYHFPQGVHVSNDVEWRLHI